MTLRSWGNCPKPRGSCVTKVVSKAVITLVAACRCYGSKIFLASNQVNIVAEMVLYS